MKEAYYRLSAGVETGWKEKKTRVRGSREAGERRGEGRRWQLSLEWEG